MVARITYTVGNGFAEREKGQQKEPNSDGVDRGGLSKVFEANGDWRAKARQPNVPTGTAYQWVKEGDKKDKRGGRRQNLYKI